MTKLCPEKRYGWVALLSLFCVIICLLGVGNVYANAATGEERCPHRLMTGEIPTESATEISAENERQTASGSSDTIYCPICAPEQYPALANSGAQLTLPQTAEEAEIEAGAQTDLLAGVSASGQEGLYAEVFSVLDTDTNQMPGLQETKVLTAEEGHHYQVIYAAKNQQGQLVAAKVQKFAGVAAQTAAVAAPALDAEIEAKLIKTERVSPSNVTFNLFDYWLNERSGDDTEGGATDNNLGINDKHALTFVKGTGNFLWSKYQSGLKGINQGIVKNRLDDDGYPVLNLTAEQWKTSVDKKEDNTTITDAQKEESLAYLFEPEDGDYKKAFSDVEGLLSLDQRTGDYSYNSSDETKGGFAKFDEETNQFTVYNKPGGTFNADGTLITGQFLPFDNLSKVFEIENNEAKPIPVGPDGNILKTINHFFGLSMEVNFYQPDGGKIETSDGNEKDMVFKFSGDDDVWVFIDDVLVADLGGIHDALSFEINFQTGAVTYSFQDEQSDELKTTIREQFKKADVKDDELEKLFRKTAGENSEAGTFRSGTEHTLKMFYLERGNYASNLSLSYNLVAPIADEIVKLDQDNQPLKDVSFGLYQADESYEIPSKEALGTFVTGEDGVAEIVDQWGNTYDFEAYAQQGISRYVLREITTPSGYRKVQDIHLRYDDQTKILVVDNSWDTGAVSNFSANIYQMGGDLVYATDGQTISDTEAQQGIVLAVPLIKMDKTSDAGNDTAWRPMYGSNLDGYGMVEPDTSGGDATKNMRKAVLKAALYQLRASQTYPDEYQGWHLSWSDEEARYQGSLRDLPGTPDRYYNVAGDREDDLAMSYYFVDPSAFGGNVASMTESEKLAYLTDLIAEAEKKYADQEDALDCAISDVAGNLLDRFAQLNLESFNRLYGSEIYVPNILNSLAVVKVDDRDETKVLEGAEFALYATREAAERGENALATGTTNARGRLVFSATEAGRMEADDTLAQYALETGKTYYLKETKSPDPALYRCNDTIVQIQVTDEGIYADAGTTEDGVKVLNGLGKLVGTMKRYAANDGINVTLRDIILKAGQPRAPVSGGLENDTTGTDGKTTQLNAHYGLPSKLVDYGLHEKDINKNLKPYFVTTQGWGYGEAYQNYNAHSQAEDPWYTAAYKENLNDEELSNLFTGSTTIVVVNEYIGYELPETGGAGDLWYKILGALIFAGGAMTLVLYCKKYKIN